MVIVSAPHLTGSRLLNFGLIDARAMSSSAGNDRLSRYSKFKDLAISSPADRVLHVQLNRPQARNALASTTITDIAECFNLIDKDIHFRSVVLSGAGKMFCAGIDIRSLMEMAEQTSASDPARRSQKLYEIIPWFQEPIIALNECKKPIIAAVHGACIGGGVDIISACDMRFVAEGTYFSVREVDLGLAADMGTLQYLPKIIGNDGLMREMVLTGRNVDTSEAKEMGLVNKVLPDEASLIDHAVKLASLIASKSPIAVQGSKVNLNFSRDNSIRNGLRFMAAWNSSMLQSDDVAKAAMSVATKSAAPDFDDI